MPNVKLYFIWCTLYLAALLWVTRSWEKMVIFGYLPLTIYNVGQAYVYRIIEPWELNHPLYPDGKEITFKLTPLLILSIATMVSFLVKMAISRVRSWWIVNILLVLVALDIVRMFWTISFVPWWVNLFNMAVESGGVVWLWWCSNYLITATEKEKKIFWEYITRLIKLVVLIASVLVIVQGIKGSPLGLIVEQSNQFPYFGSGTGELGLISRPIGLTEHANSQAFDIFMRLAAWVLLIILTGKIEWKKQKWLIWPLLAIVWLQSRVIYAGLLVLTGWWLYYGGWESLKKISISGKYKWLMLGAVTVIVMVTGVRLLGTVLNMSGDNGWKTREGLLSVSKRLISHNLWMGVGKDNFIGVAFRQDLTGFMKTFPETVHNGFVLILAEQGVIGLLFWTELMIILLGKWLMTKKFDGRIKSFFILALLSQFMVMYFQPFSSPLTWLGIIGVLLLSDGETEAKKSPIG